MNRKTKQLLEENNRAEAALSPEGNALLTDLVVYLRVSRLSEWQQEAVRRDLTEMLLSGEARGQSAADVIGPDPEAFCREVIAALPPRSPADLALEILDGALLYLAILTGIWLVGTVPMALAGRGSLSALPVTAGDLFAGVLLLGFADLLVRFICKTALRPTKKPMGKATGFLLVFAVLAALLVLLFLVRGVWFTAPLFHLPLVGGLALCVVPALARLILQRII